MLRCGSYKKYIVGRIFQTALISTGITVRRVWSSKRQVSSPFRLQTSCHWLGSPNLPLFGTNEFTFLQAEKIPSPIVKLFKCT